MAKKLKKYPRLWLVFFIPLFIFSAISLGIQYIDLVTQDDKTVKELYSKSLKFYSKFIYNDLLSQNNDLENGKKFINTWFAQLISENPQYADGIIFFEAGTDRIAYSIPEIESVGTLKTLNEALPTRIRLKNNKSIRAQIYINDKILNFKDLKNVQIGHYFIDKFLDEDSRYTQQYVINYTLILMLVLFVIVYITSILFRRPINSLIKTIKEIDPETIDNLKIIPFRTQELRDIQTSMLQVFERLGKAFKERRQFNSDLAHQLRTPLTILILQLDEMYEAAVEIPKLQEIIYEHMETIKKYANMIDSLLLISKLESMEQLVNPKVFDLSGLIYSLVELYSPIAYEMGINFELDLDYSLRLYGDERIFSQALINIIDNAFKYGASGKRIVIKSYLLTDKQAITIRNYGPPIEPKDINRIFDRFYRVQDKVEGSGIGLNLTKKIVEIHKGAIEIESSIKEGTVFKIYLPLTE